MAKAAILESTTLMTIDEIVEREINLLKDIIQTGTPECYTSFDSYLCDWGPEFSWNEVMVAEMQALLDNPEWLALAEQVKSKTTWDFKWAAEETIADFANDL